MIARGLAAMVACALALGAARPASAGTCSISAVANAAFSPYNVFSGTPDDTTASVSYSCLVGLAVQIDLSTGASGNYTNRSMTLTGNPPLAYNLFLDAAHTQVWGNGLNGTFHYTVTIALLTVVTIPIYARIPAGQDVAAGAYADTVTVTLSY